VLFVGGCQCPNFAGDALKLGAHALRKPVPRARNVDQVARDDLALDPRRHQWLELAQTIVGERFGNFAPELPVARRGLNVVALRAAEDRKQFHEVAASEPSLGLGTEYEQPRREHVRLVSEHPVDLVEIADVDAKLERGGAHDAGIGSSMKAVLGVLALLFGDSAVMHEHVDIDATHVLCDRLGRGARLAKEQAFSPLGNLRSIVGDIAMLSRLVMRICRRPGFLGGSITWPERHEEPCSHARIAAGLPTVALSPIRCTSCLETLASRSMTLIKCAPRSVPATACTSSTTIVRRSENSATSLTRRDTSMTSSDSGVVMSSSVGCLRNFVRSWVGVSPCHTKRSSPTIWA